MVEYTPVVLNSFVFYGCFYYAFIFTDKIASTFFIHWWNFIHTLTFLHPQFLYTPYRILFTNFFQCIFYLKCYKTWYLFLLFLNQNKFLWFLGPFAYTVNGNSFICTISDNWSKVVFITSFITMTFYITTFFTMVFFKNLLF